MEIDRKQLDFMLKQLLINIQTKNTLGISVIYTRFKNYGYSEKQLLNLLKASYPNAIKTKVVKKKKR